MKEYIDDCAWDMMSFVLYVNVVYVWRDISKRRRIVREEGYMVYIEQVYVISDLGSVSSSHRQCN